MLNVVITPTNWNNTLSRVLMRLRLKLTNSNNQDKKPSKDVRLLSIAVLTESRGKGVAKQLTEEFENIVRNSGYDCYGLSVHNNNYGAIKFYDKIGLVKTGEKDNSIYYSKSLNVSVE